ncbi:hypothetical protein EYF80_064888 [Liparis tanakae]|uniref:Uncharacterized protein n=1 Tax=Liparis tanakae TaxID=230148 RepID=A0A4Z2E894_9TELE|nr:hypothetical protein EYF80_064888 [Liparis tanakae]
MGPHGGHGDHLKTREGKAPPHHDVLAVAPSVAAVPHDATGVLGNMSAPPSFSAILRAEMESLKWSRQASVAHSRHRVFPVPDPVGLLKPAEPQGGSSLGDWSSKTPWRTGAPRPHGGLELQDPIKDWSSETP